MAKKLYEEASIKAIADAIRGKIGGTDTYKVSDMAALIEGIETGGINATAGTITVSQDTQDYILTHGLGETPIFFVLAMAARPGELTNKTKILIAAYGWSDMNLQARMTTSSYESAPVGVVREYGITVYNTKATICDANANNILLANWASTYKLIAGATYYWLAIGSGVF